MGTNCVPLVEDMFLFSFQRNLSIGERVRA